MNAPDQTATVPAQQTSPQGIDPELIKQAVVEGFRQANAPQQRTVNDMTPEEKAKYFEVFDPAQNNFVDDFTKAFNEAESPAERAKVLATYRDGVVNQALRGAEIMMDNKFNDFQQQFAPARQFAVEHQREAIWEQFQGKHADLKDHRELIDAVATQLSAQGYKPATPDEAFSKIAETAKIILGKSGVQFTVVANTGSGARPAMAQMSSRSTTGGNTAATPEGKGIAKFWPSRRR